MYNTFLYHPESAEGGHTLLMFGRSDSVSIGKSSVIGRRREQQDCILTDNDMSYMENGRMIALLCDGMGGMQSGGAASQLATANVFYAFHALKEGTDIIDFFDEALTQADRDVHSLRNPDGTPMRTGTTFVGVVIEDGKLYLANVGDSHGYLIRDRQLNLITQEHNLMTLLLEEVARGEMTLEEARSNPKREALTSYVGMGGLRYKQLTNPPCVLHPGDFIVLCSDGLYRSVSEREILEVVCAAGTDVQAAADQLTALAVSKGKPNQDNTSVVVILYQDLD